MSKLTQDEIRTAAEAVNSTYYEEGYWSAREAADELKAQMVVSGNTDSESISTFNRYTGLSYDY